MVDQKAEKSFVLPLQIVGSVDLSRLIRELETLDDFLHQASIRKPGTAVKLPRSSRLLEEFASENGASLLEESHRKWLIEQAKVFKDKAPRIHMSFAVDPSATFTQKILVWLRQNVHPYILLDVGLQPTIAAGCIVRTTNHVFDLSLREYLQQNRELLSRGIEGLK